MTVQYTSTRSTADSTRLLSFSEVLLTGTAPDGGLYVPTAVPPLPAVSPPPPGTPPSDTGQPPPKHTQPLPNDPAANAYADLATQVIAPYTAGSIPDERLASMAADAYSAFRHPDVCPLVAIGENHYLLELFHGPTFAFKDIALQLVARMFDNELENRGDRLMIVGATSGDTGSAAMQAIAGRDRINIVMLYPAERISEVQRRQMTTLTAPNVHAAAVEGTFDDCQDLVKAVFADEELRSEMHLAAVNSINWARIMTQIVYYVWSHRALNGGPDSNGGARPVTFCVPTGNFGNVLAGHYARRMGLDIDRLIVASNANDILSRFLATGKLSAHEVVATLSPSMDIQISSNLERLLFELLDCDGTATSTMLTEFRATGSSSLNTQQHRRLQAEFCGGRLDDQSTAAVIAGVHADTGILIDPHTAVGVGVTQRYHRPGELVVTLATAHPAKFPDATAAAIGKEPDMPDGLAMLYDRPERCIQLPCDLSSVKSFVRSVSQA